MLIFLLFAITIAFALVRTAAVGVATVCMLVVLFHRVPS